MSRRYVIRLQFPDGDVRLSFDAHERELYRQYRAMIESDSPSLRARGWRKLEELRDRSIAAQVDGFERTVNATHGAQANRVAGEERRDAIGAWVDKHLHQRAYRDPPTASHLASLLLSPTSDFEWPDNVKRVGKDTVRKIIGKHLEKTEK